MKKPRATKKSAAPKGAQPLKVPHGVIPPQLPEWTAEDIAALAAFLRSSTGQKLQAYQLSGIAGYFEWATTQEEPLRACGEAQGFKKHRDFILSLAVAQNSKPEQPADTNGTADSLAHLRP